MRAPPLPAGQGPALRAAADDGQLALSPLGRSSTDCGGRTATGRGEWKDETFTVHCDSVITLRKGSYANTDKQCRRTACTNPLRPPRVVAPDGLSIPEAAAGPGGFRRLSGFCAFVPLLHRACLPWLPCPTTSPPLRTIHSATVPNTRKRARGKLGRGCLTFDDRHQAPHQWIQPCLRGPARAAPFCSVHGGTIGHYGGKLAGRHLFS